MAASTRSRVSGRTFGCSFITRETVWCDTPASRATSAITGGRDRLTAASGALTRLRAFSPGDDVTPCLAVPQVLDGLLGLTARVALAQVLDGLLGLAPGVAVLQVAQGRLGPAARVAGAHVLQRFPRLAGRVAVLRAAQPGEQPGPPAASLPF